MYLPIPISHHRLLMREIVMTMPLTLRPITQVMGSHHADRASETDKNAEVNKDIFQPLWTFVAVVD